MQKNVLDFPKENRLIIDWFSFTSRKHSRDELIYLLGMVDCPFVYSPGNKGFQHKVSYEGVHVHWCDPDFDSPLTPFVWLEMSGKGCRTYETHGGGNFKFWFDQLNTELDKDPQDRDLRVKRIDVAFDDMTGVLNIDRVFRDSIEQNFTSRFRENSVYATFKNGLPQISVDFGSKQSNVFVRIYDKAAERGFTPEQVPHWVRCEFQLKDENAAGFLSLSYQKDLQTVYSSALRNYLCFRVPDDFDSNKSRWQEADYWVRFLNDAVGQSIWEKPGSDYNALAAAEDYLLTQPLGAIQTLLKTMGVEKFVNKVMSEPAPRNPKYDKMVADYFLGRLSDIDADIADAQRRCSVLYKQFIQSKLEVDYTNYEKAYDILEDLKRKREHFVMQIRKADASFFDSEIRKKMNDILEG